MIRLVVRDLYALKDSGPFDIHSNEEVSVDLELKKQPPCYNTLLTGRVHCECTPVADATVKVFDCHGHPIAQACSGNDGLYRIENDLLPGEYMAIASASCCGTSNAKFFQIRVYETTRLNFTLQYNPICQNGIVYGKVLEEGGVTPVRHAYVTLWQADCKDGLAYTVKTNKDGQYILYDIVPGKYRIKAKKTGYHPMAFAELTIRSQGHVLLNLKLEKETSDFTGTIYGTITSRDLPVPKIPVFLYRLDPLHDEMLIQVQTANDDGEYLFASVEKGTYMVNTTLEDGRVFTRRIAF